MTHAPLARRGLRAGLAGLITAAVAGTTLATAPTTTAAEAPARAAGTTSLAAVLGADGTRFDRDWNDFDIVERTVLRVLKANPDSPVALLTQGRKRATAFVPTDRAFRALARDLTGRAPKTERATFRLLARTAGVDTLETVLLYHVIPGKTLSAKRVVARDGKRVHTAAGIPIRVRVNGQRVTIVDRDSNDRNARVIVTDVNKGNRQIAHAVNRVLRPVNL